MQTGADKHDSAGVLCVLRSDRPLSQPELVWLEKQARFVNTVLISPAAMQAACVPPKSSFYGAKMKCHQQKVSTGLEYVERIRELIGIRDKMMKTEVNSFFSGLGIGVIYL